MSPDTQSSNRKTHEISGLEMNQLVLNDQYRLERPLGSDGSELTWQALDLQSGARHALRFFERTSPQYFANLKRDLTPYQRLNHPNIATIHRLVSDSSHGAVVMELIDGANLRNSLKRQLQGNFDPEDIRYWLEELCQALHYAHSVEGAAHGNLDLRYLLLTRKGHLKIACFGVHRVLRLITASGESYSTRQAPSGVSEDIFAFGAIVYELLTGSPVEEDSPTLSLAEVRKTRGVTRAIPPHWEEVVLSCLSPNPSDRPGSIRVAAERLGLDLQSVTWRDPSRTKGQTQSRTAHSDSVSTLRDSVAAGSTRQARVLQSYPTVTQRRRTLKVGILVWTAAIACAAFLLAPGLLNKDDQNTPVLNETIEGVSAAEPREVEKQATAERIANQKAIAEELEEPLNEERWTEVAEKLKAVQDAEELIPELFLARAKLYQSERELEQALEVVRTLLRQDPTHPGATRLKAQLHEEANEPEKTVRAAQWALRHPHNGRDSELHRIRGRAYFRLGELSKASADLKLAERYESRPNAETHRSLALIYAAEDKKENIRPALEHYDTAIAVAPENKSLLREKALLAMRFGDYKTAFESLHGLDAENDPETILNRLFAAFEIEHWEDVSQDASHLLGLGSEWDWLRPYLAEARFQMGLHQEAIDDLNVYLEEQPEDVEAIYRLATYYLENEKYAETIDHFSNVIEIDPSHDDSYQGRAIAYYYSKDYRKAIKDCSYLFRKNSPILNIDTYDIAAWSNFYLGLYDRAKDVVNAGLVSLSNEEDLERLRELSRQVAEGEAAKRIRDYTPPSPKPQKRNFFSRLFSSEKR